MLVVERVSIRRFCSQVAGGWVPNADLEVRNKFRTGNSKACNETRSGHRVVNLDAVDSKAAEDFCAWEVGSDTQGGRKVAHGHQIGAFSDFLGCIARLEYVIIWYIGVPGHR